MNTATRRRALQRLLLMPAVPALAPAWAQDPFDAAALRRALQTGGVVLALRHALAPGTFDPPGFRVDDCSTQRNLNDTGRAQSRRIGRWFVQAGLVPAQVRTSPWCRCIDTAQLAFGSAEVWPALGSPHGTSETVRSTQRTQLLQALAAVSAQAGRLEVWVTHAFVQSAVAGSSTGVGEALALRATGTGRADLLGRLLIG
jgi:phosphohistidine phosphatase SixA